MMKMKVSLERQETPHQDTKIKRMTADYLWFLDVIPSSSSHVLIVPKA
jgi:hypothetical protein